MYRYFYDEQGNIVSEIKFRNATALVDFFPGATAFLDTETKLFYDKHIIDPETQEIKDKPAIS